MPKVVKTISKEETFVSKRPGLRKQMLEGSKAIIESSTQLSLSNCL